MPTHKLAAARAIGRALRSSEDTLDTSIANVARLVASIAEGRLQAGVAAQTGHDAFMQASATLTTLSQARDHVVSCHRQLERVRDVQGIDPEPAGCTPKISNARTQPARLKSVA